MIGMVKLAPGPVMYRRRNGVWAKDRALSVQMRARRGRPLLREIRRRDMIGVEVSRWDGEEVRRQAAASKLYNEPLVNRPSAPTRAAVITARRAARAARRESVEAREDALIAEILAERKRSADLMTSALTASAARLTGASQRAANAAAAQRSRESAARMTALCDEVLAVGR
ncbi:hypothetical protein [Gordonia terrae]